MEIYRVVMLIGAIGWGDVKMSNYHPHPPKNHVEAFLLRFLLIGAFSTMWDLLATFFFFMCGPFCLYVVFIGGGLSPPSPYKISAGAHGHAF